MNEFLKATEAIFYTMLILVAVAFLVRYVF